MTARELAEFYLIATMLIGACVAIFYFPDWVLQ